MIKKAFVFAVLVLLALSGGAWGQSIKVTSPHAGSAWCIGGPCTITWTKSGTMPNTVKIRLRRAGAPETEASVWAITDSTANDGDFGPLTVPTSVPAGNYFIRVRTIGDPDVIGDSANFTVKACPGGMQAVVLPPGPTPAPGNLFSLKQTMVIHAPKGGDVWKPLTNYSIIWEVVRNKYPGSAYDFDVKLVRVDNPSFTPQVLKKSISSVAKITATSNLYTFDWKFLGSMNIPSGKYKLTFQSVKIPDFKGESGVITVQNSIASNTAFLGEDEPDLAIEDVYYDYAKKSMWLRIKNQGLNSYAGPLTIKYQFKGGNITYPSPGCSDGGNEGETKFPNITLNKFQSNAYLICKWPCFDKRPADFFPITGPVSYHVYFFVTGKDPVSRSGVICKCKGPDIIVDDPFQIQGKYDPDYLSGFRQVSLDPRNFNWISENTFEAKVAVKVRNWGCQGLQFKIMLYMDGNYLNGKKEAILGTVTLQSGQETYFVSGPLKFSIPRDEQYYKMLLVAHPNEITGEGYPDAYKNNFIITHVRLKEKSNTIRGQVDW